MDMLQVKALKFIKIQKVQFQEIKKETPVKVM